MKLKVLKMSWFLQGCSIVFGFAFPYELISETFSLQKEAMAVILSWCVLFISYTGTKLWRKESLVGGQGQAGYAFKLDSDK